MNNDGHHHHHHLQSGQPPPNSSRRVMKQQESANQIQPPALQKCPRCDSTNTKFCYYNNYSLSQPRYFCKACRRYWTQGGNLRNVPVGGGCRKSKRPKPSSSSSSPATPSAHIDQISRTNIQSLAANSSLSSSSIAAAAASAPPAFLPQSFSGLFNHHSLVHQNFRPADPLLSGNSIPALYSSSTAGGFFSPLGMAPLPQPLPPQGGLVSGNDQFSGANLALFQGMNFQNLKPGHHMSTPQQMIANSQEQNGDDHRAYVGSHLQQRPSNSWAQGFINNTAAAASTGLAAGFWNGGPANAGENSSNQAGTSSSNLNNQWSDSNSTDDKNQGFDPSH